MKLALPLTLALVLLVAGGACSEPGSAGPSETPSLADRIDGLVEAHLASAPAAGAAVAVVRGSDTLVMRGCGLADRDTRRSAGPGTVYEIGSITKHATAAAIMRLVEQGKVGLDDDLSRYVPAFPLQGRHVSIRQLLNHTSGIPGYTSDPAYTSHADLELPPDSIIGFVAGDPFDFEPGTAWRYNNTGYVLLGMVIEKVSGQRYATYVDEQFFRPLALRQTRYCPSAVPGARDTSFALGYSAPPPLKRLELTPTISMSGPFAAGPSAPARGSS